MSIGQRDALLLTLRELTFGSELVSVASCPACNEALELSFQAAEIRVAAKTNEAKNLDDFAETAAATPAEAAVDVCANDEVGEVLAIHLKGYEVLCRLPNSLDLAALAGSKDVQRSQQVLLERCVLSARHLDEEINVAELPAEIFAAVASQMEAADPQADVQLNLSCLSCGHSWQAAFDIESFFWSELQVWAERLLRDVHQLARAYGWHEADILAMSPHRRQIYLEMLGR